MFHYCGPECDTCKQPNLKSVTHEFLEHGRQMQQKTRTVARRQLSFQSYPVNDQRFGLLGTEQPQKNVLRSTYKHDYIPPFSPRCGPMKNPHDIETLDPMFNRKTVSEFEVCHFKDTKFLDDHLLEVSEAKKKRRFFTQLRNETRIFNM